MVDQMMQQLVPQHMTNGEPPSIEEGHGVLELIAPEAFQPHHRLVVNMAIPGGEQLDLARPLEIWRLVLKAEPPQSDSEA